MNCPRCGVVNPPAAARCDCGHDFATGLLRAFAPFHSTESAARLAVIMLALAVVVDVIAVGAGLVQAGLVGRIAAGQTFPPEQLQAADARQRLIGIAQIVTLLAGALAFLRWLSLAYGNLPALGAVPRFSRTWAVVFFLIPILNLFRPYQVVRELWRGSGGGGAAIVGWWWTAHLGTSFLGAQSLTLIATAKTPGEFLIATWAAVAADVCGTLAPALALIIVRGIEEGQARLVAGR